MTRAGDREIGVVSGRLPDNPGWLACMKMKEGVSTTTCRNDLCVI